MEITYELEEELWNLAAWEGCETGDLCFTLIELRRGFEPYVSKKFWKALEDEIIYHYKFLKHAKEQEEYDQAKYELSKDGSIDDGSRISIKLDDMDLSFSSAKKIDPHDSIALADVLEEVVRMLRTPILEDKEIF